MIAVILAAGMATRLRPLTDDRPKCLLQVGTKTLLARTIDALVENAISELVIVTGYRGEMIRQAVEAAYPALNVHYIDNADYRTTNNIYSLWLAKPFIDGRETLLLDSDILLDASLIRAILNAEGSALALNRHTLGEEEMKIVTAPDGRMVEISKTCDPQKAVGESVGVEKMTADYTSALFRELAKMIVVEGLSGVFYEQAFQRLIAQGHTFNIIDTTDYFSMELDTVADFELADRLTADQ